MQILLKCLVLALSLFIHLQMVCSNKAWIDAQVMVEGCPELLGELGPTIENDALRYTSAS
jgi:hypothetical protein